MLRYSRNELTELLDEGAAYGVYISDGELKKNSDDINRILKELGIRAKVSKFYGGPAYSEYMIRLNDHEAYRDLEAHSEEIRKRMDVKSFRIMNERIYLSSREVSVEMSNRVISEVRLRDFFEDFRFRSSLMTIPLGSGTHRRSVTNLSDSLIVGGSDRNEVGGFLYSSIMSLICSADPGDLGIIIAGSDDCGFSEFSEIPHLKRPVLRTADEVFESLKILKGDLASRYDMFYDSQSRSYMDYNRRVRFSRGEQVPNILFVISDISLIKGREDIIDLLRHVILRGRNAGICFMIAGSGKEGGEMIGRIKDLIDNRVSFRTETEEISRMILDLGKAVTLLGTGDLIYSTPTDTVKLQSPEVTSEEIKRVADYIIENKEELYNRDLNSIRRRIRDKEDRLG